MKRCNRCNKYRLEQSFKSFKGTRTVRCCKHCRLGAKLSFLKHNKTKQSEKLNKLKCNINKVEKQMDTLERKTKRSVEREYIDNLFMDDLKMTFMC